MADTDVGMPILSTLGKESQAPELFMNAFYKASQINIQKQNMEKQLMALQVSMAQRDREFELDKEKFAFDQKYKTSQLARAYDAMGIRAELGEGRLNLMDQTFRLKAARQDAINSGVGELSDALSQASEKNTPGSQAFDNDVAQIGLDHASVIDTPEGKRVMDFFTRQHKQAALTSNKYADILRKNFNASIAMQSRGGTGLNKDDMQRPETDFVFDKGNIGIPEYPVPIPGPGGTTVGVQFRNIDPSELSKLPLEQQAKKYPGLRWRRSTKANYDNLKGMWNSMQDIGRGNLTKMPADTTIQDNVMPAPADPSQRQAGQPYSTPKGTFTWDGSGWQQP